MGNVTRALHVLRNELAPMTTDMDRLRTLSRSDSYILTFALLKCYSFMMCSSTEDLCERANWDGAKGTSRRRLLIELQSQFFWSSSAIRFLTTSQEFIPSATMI